MKRLINKIRNYVDQRYLKKYVDNRYWQLANNFEDKVTTLLIEEFPKLIDEYYSWMDVEMEKKTNPPFYIFTRHKITRYIYKINDCIIDPKYNWVILGRQKIFRYSYPLIEDPWDTNKPRPSVIDNLFRKKIIRLEKGILVKYLCTNYFHFFIDGLPELFLCDDFGIPEDVPLIVPYNFNKFPYVVDYFNKFPSKRKIIIQERDQYLNVGELYIAKDIFCSKYISTINNNIRKKGISNQIQNLDSPEFLFVVRKRNSFRSVSNCDEIEQIAKDNGFAVMEPGDYSWEEQVKLFSKAKKIIGIHGAGMTNIIFCQNEKVRVLEVYPGKDFTPEHYKNICIQLNYDYSFIEGEGLDSKLQFHIDKELFTRSVQKLILEHSL